MTDDDAGGGTLRRTPSRKTSRGASEDSPRRPEPPRPQPNPPSWPLFVADEMLGKLARDLRTLGYDVVYMRHTEDDEVLARAQADGRVLLTRDRELAGRAGDLGVFVESRDPPVQVREVLAALHLAPMREAFLSRCIECNGVLVEAPGAPVPASAEGRATWRCPDCARVYWWGTHVDEMIERLGPHVRGGLEKRSDGPT